MKLSIVAWGGLRDGQFPLLAYRPACASVSLPTRWGRARASMLSSGKQVHVNAPAMSNARARVYRDARTRAHPQHDARAHTLSSDQVWCQRAWRSRGNAAARVAGAVHVKMPHVAANAHSPDSRNRSMAGHVWLPSPRSAGNRCGHRRRTRILVETVVEAVVKPSVFLETVFNVTRGLSLFLPR